MGITGKVSLKPTPDATEAQTYTYAKARPGREHFTAANGTPMHLRRVRPRSQPPSTKQSQNQRRMTAATAAWKALSPEERATYNTRAGNLGLSGFNLFVREFTAAQPLSSF